MIAHDAELTARQRQRTLAVAQRERHFAIGRGHRRSVVDRTHGAILGEARCHRIVANRPLTAGFGTGRAHLAHAELPVPVLVSALAQQPVCKAVGHEVLHALQTATKDIALGSECQRRHRDAEVTIGRADILKRGEEHAVGIPAGRNASG